MDDKKLFSIKDILVLAGIILFFCFIWFSTSPANLNESTKPFIGEVVWEEHVCTDRMCDQKLVVGHAGKEYQVNSSVETPLKIGDKVKIIKYYEKRHFLRNRFSRELPHHYKIYSED